MFWAQWQGQQPSGWKASPQPWAVPRKQGRKGEGQGYQPWANAPTRTTRRQAQADTQGRTGGAKRSGTAEKQARKGRDGCRCKSAVEVREASRRSSSRRGCERRRRPDRPCHPQGGARHSGDWWRHQSPLVFLGDFSALPARSKRALQAPFRKNRIVAPDLIRGPAVLSAPRKQGPGSNPGRRPPQSESDRGLRLHIRRYFARHARRHLFSGFHRPQQIAAGDLLAIGFAMTAAQQFGDQCRIGFDALKARRR